jgi:TonB family protein
VALLLLIAVLTGSTAPTADAQRPTAAPPSGNRIVAQDGDVVVIENDARVRIVRRREASVRVVFNAEERWLVLLVDYAMHGAPPDGRVDSSHFYREVGGAWPLGARWEGAATIEQYSTIERGGPGVGLGVVTPHGLVQLLARPEQELRDAEAVAVLVYNGGGFTGSTGNLTFDEAERWCIAELRRNDGVMRSPPGVAHSGSMSFGASASGADPAAGALRVGGNVRPPVKVFDVPPVRPELAVSANVRGIVILEVTIDADGVVKHVRVLRSIPMLDAAALEAVRQWRYEPTTIDGKAVPVVMTVSVTF